MKLKRLFLDIETSPNVVYSWRVGYKIQISADNIVEERRIVCVGYKWEGQKEVQSLQWDKDMGDKAMLEGLIPVLNEADEIVMHNGDKFDLPWIATRCFFHKLRLYPDYKTIDTLQWARRKFYFNSNRLDYISKYAGRKGKLKTEFSLWKKVCGLNDRKALAYMVTYCKGDVLELEAAYKRLAEYMKPKTHVGVFYGRGKYSCPHCGSVHFSLNGKRTTAGGTLQHRCKCSSCHRFFSVNAKVVAAAAKAQSESSLKLAA